MAHSRARRTLGLRVACALTVACVSRAAVAQNVELPLVIERRDAVPPPEATRLTSPLEVMLTIIVAEDGTVESPSVLHSAGASFDDAALRAVTSWRFRPASRDGKPVRSRIRVSFNFSPPAAPSETAAPAPRESPSPTEVPPQKASPTVTSGVSNAAPPPAPPTEITVQGAATQRVHGASDFQITVGALRLVPRQNAADYLKLAPGILLTNESGDGHAEQVFLRGFDAREGQDVEFSVDGVPINDSGNIHGNGYADTHFIIPELIQGLRVTEGPFSPYQGNYAVAGSADYHLGLEARGVTAKATYGSWNTQRLVVLWGPPSESSQTFGAAEAYQTDGYGVNRSSKRTSAMGQYEIPLSSGATLRIGGQAYATHYQSAGVIREDDWKAGRVGFFGTEDPLQGGDASRFSLYVNYDKAVDASGFSQGLYLIRRDMRTREDFTGFLLDTQDALDTLHDQRGDLIDQNFGAWTLGGRGAGRWSTKLGGLEQSVDVGYQARVDLTNATQYRDTVPGDIPYKLETDLDSTLTDVGLFIDASARPLKWLTFRGGVRVDTFSFDVLNNCAAQGDFDNPSKSQPPTNQSCHDQMLNGAHREPIQRSSTGAMKVMPRVTMTAGPVQHFNFSLSYGAGVRSIDPSYISQDLDTPFASVRAYEGGVMYAHALGAVELSARSIFFETKVDRDLVFSQTAGRNVLANGTTRVGWAGALRLAAPFFDESANLTLVNPTFDDTHLAIPYVPSLVFRDDAAIFHELPLTLGAKPLKGSLALGWTYVGRRALPYNEVSDIISVIDANAALGWRGLELSLAVTNLFDVRYRLGEYNYASDFHSEPEPTLVAARAFTAGAPRGVFLSLSGNLGGAS
ncbi:MAG TPA: TonB family protein [Polyangiaceae bacterium]|nr:TonB family protein [Polyangiaceae bacterium]